MASSGASFVFDGQGLDDIVRDLGRAAERVGKEVDVAMLEIGTEITERAKVIAEGHSKTIASTIEMIPAPGVITIRAGNEQVAIAALYERGNRGSRVTAKTFRHPVFGNPNVWVEQPRFPFLRPALAADRRSITKRMEAVWDRALGPYRL